MLCKAVSITYNLLFEEIFFSIGGDSGLLGINPNAFRLESNLLRPAAVSCHIRKSNHLIFKTKPGKKRRIRFKIEVSDGHNMKCVKEEIIIKKLC